MKHASCLWFLLLVAALFTCPLACGNSGGGSHTRHIIDDDSSPVDDDDNDNDDQSPDDDDDDNNDDSSPSDDDDDDDDDDNDNDNDNDNDDQSPDDDDNDNDDSSPDDDDDNDDDDDDDDDDNDDDNNDDNNGDNDDDNDDSDNNDDDDDTADDDTACPLIDNENGTATDPCTGYVWQITPPATQYAQTAAKAYCAGLTLAGHGGWRLPDIDALRSLVRGCPATQTGGACGATDACASSNCGNGECTGCVAGGGPAGGCYWPAALAGACAYYWSATPLTDDGGVAWDINFDTAFLNSNGLGNDVYARCVYGTDDDDDNDDDNDDIDLCALDDHQDGTATDPCTGLTRQIAPPATEFAQADAAAYCAGLTLGGHGGWSLPEIDVLRTLVRGCPVTMPRGTCDVTDDCQSWSCWTGPCTGCPTDRGPANGCYWPTALAGACDWYWSASAVADEDGFAWDIDFNAGFLLDGNASGRAYYARCVYGADDDDDDDNDDDDNDDIDNIDDDTCALVDNQDGTATDPCSGLIWQLNPSTRPYAHTIAAAYCAALTLAGHGGWTLPGMNDLRSLVHGCPLTGPGGACGIADQCRSQNCWNGWCAGCAVGDGPANGCYWSTGLAGPCDKYWSNTYCTGGVAWDFNYDAASVNSDELVMQYYARCVFAAGDDDDDDDNDDDDDDACALVDNQDGTATDPCTGLTWQITPSATMYTKADAVAHCAGLTLAGHGGWVLPDLDSLRSLVRGCPADMTGGACGATDACSIFPNCWSSVCLGCSPGSGPANGCYWPAALAGACDWYWSASAVPDVAYGVWDLNFDAAFVSYNAYSVENYARCMFAPENNDNDGGQ